MKKASGRKLVFIFLFCRREGIGRGCPNSALGLWICSRGRWTLLTCDFSALEKRSWDSHDEIAQPRRKTKKLHVVSGMGCWASPSLPQVVLRKSSRTGHRGKAGSLTCPIRSQPPAGRSSPPGRASPPSLNGFRYRLTSCRVLTSSAA